MTQNILKKWLLITALCAGLLLDGASAMSLHDALAIAYKNNPDLKSERAGLQALDESMPQALSGFLPDVTISYTRGRNRNRANGNARNQFTSDTRALTINQPIFDGGRTLAAIDEAGAQIEAGRETLRDAEQTLLGNAVAAYMDVLRTREVLKLSQHNENVLAEQLRASEQRFELGESTKTDVSQSKSRLARAQSDRITAEGDVVTAEAVFKRIYLMDAPATIRMPENLPKLPASYHEGLELAIQNNPRLQSLHHSYEAAGYNVNEQKGVLLPTVDLVGTISRSDNPSFFTQSSDDERLTLDVTVPLFQGGDEYSAIREAKRSREQVGYSVDETRNQIVEQFTSAWQQINTAKANVEAGEANVDAAEVALDGVQKEYEFGSRTTLDVLDAEQERFDAKVNLITAKRNYVVATYNVLNTVGDLTAQKLSLNTPIYDPKSHYRKVRYKVIGF
jgi:TolC family type I secretion outer membrane protein